MNKAIKKQITRRTNEEKLGLIQECEKSGQSIASFCRQQGFADSPSLTPDAPSLYAELVWPWARSNSTSQ